MAAPPDVFARGAGRVVASRYEDPDDAVPQS
jgi:hypothetical protein